MPQISHSFLSLLLWLIERSLMHAHLEIHRASADTVDTRSELSCTKRWNWWQVYCMNISVFSLFFCIFFVSYSTHFLVFNTSVLYFQGVRPLLQPGMCHHLVPSLKQVVKGLEEVADQDHSWRAELMMQVTLTSPIFLLLNPTTLMHNLLRWHTKLFN